jgi:hypothetical protein
MSEIQTYFDKHCFEYNRDYIFALNEQDNGPINNVISHLQEHCYGVQFFDDKEYLEYRIFYIDHKFELSGLGFELSLELDFKTRTSYTIEFCKLINDKYPHADIIDTFNTFQSQLRGGFEKLGFFTIGNEISMFKRKNGIAIFPPSKGIMSFSMIEKKELYRWFFNESENDIQTDEKRTKKIYLILDSTNNLIKIGQSFYPKTREKTLHGVSPDWDIITTWIAPVSEERFLHKKYEHKRTRGEWFDLNFSDLKEIKEYMKKYKNCL